MKTEYHVMFLEELITVARRMGFEDLVNGLPVQLLAWLSIDDPEAEYALLLRNNKVLCSAPVDTTLNMTLNGVAKSVRLDKDGNFVPCEHRPYRSIDEDEVIWHVELLGPQAMNYWDSLMEVYRSNQLDQTPVNTPNSAS